MLSFGSNNIEPGQHVNRNKFVLFLPLDTLQIAGNRFEWPSSNRLLKSIAAIRFVAFSTTDVESYGTVCFATEFTGLADPRLHLEAGHNSAYSEAYRTRSAAKTAKLESSADQILTTTSGPLGSRD